MENKARRGETKAEVRRLLDIGMSHRQIADHLGLSPGTVSFHAKGHTTAQHGRVEAAKNIVAPLPPRGSVRRYIITSAQNNTRLHNSFWSNLQALCQWYDAQLMVSRFTYKKESYGAKSVKPGRVPSKDDASDLWYDERIEPQMVCDDRVQLAPGLVFCGELNILPTASRPLSGLTNYTGTDSCIVPHAKIAMQSIPSAKRQPAKLCYTTGAATLRNYVAKKAGQKAEFHHAYAALIVEVDSDGDWFVRQLNATDDGTVHDLGLVASDGCVCPVNNGVTGIVWGDIHEQSLEPDVRKALWGPGGMLAALDPMYQFAHDLLDFRNRNHHDLGNPHAAFAKFVRGQESVEDEIKRCAAFLRESESLSCQTVVVASNHDAALTKWLRAADYRTDPVNAIFFLEAQLEAYRHIQRGERFDPVAWALRKYGAPEKTVFLEVDEPFQLHGIECGNHGHLGPDGARGTALGLSRAGAKMVVGHTHSAAIVDGLYVTGVTGALDQGYNVGPSSWSRTHCLIYSNGKRTLITMRGKKWRAVP